MQIKLEKKPILELVKKSYALAAKEDEIKNNLAYQEIIFSWNIHDIGLWFTVKLSSGRVAVSEGRAKDPDVVFYNDKIEHFHRGNTEDMFERDMKDEASFRWTGNARYIRHISKLCGRMREHYKELVAAKQG